MKKSAFLTFIFACWPGAGQMYLGYTKRGFSLMTIFLLLMDMAMQPSMNSIIMGIFSIHGEAWEKNLGISGLSIAYGLIERTESGLQTENSIESRFSRKTGT